MMMKNNFDLSILVIIGLFINFVSSSNNVGEYVAPSDVPYQVSVQANGEHICGGALIYESHVLTAARCFVERTETVKIQVYNPNVRGELTVVAGISSLDDKNGEVRRNVVEIILPKDYSPLEFHIKDVAVLKLKSPISSNDNPNVGYVHLPITKETYAGKYAIVTGFHPLVEVTEDGAYIFDTTNSKLNKMNPLIIHNHVCKNSYSANVIRDSNLCTYAFAVNKQFYGSCMLDTGAPLVFNRTTIIGISSAGPTRCGKLPSVYTRVASFLEFIYMAQRGDLTSEMKIIRL